MTRSQTKLIVSVVHPAQEVYLSLRRSDGRHISCVLGDVNTGHVAEVPLARALDGFEYQGYVSARVDGVQVRTSVAF